MTVLELDVDVGEHADHELRGDRLDPNDGRRERRHQGARLDRPVLDQELRRQVDRQLGGAALAESEAAVEEADLVALGDVAADDTRRRRLEHLRGQRPVQEEGAEAAAVAVGVAAYLGVRRVDRETQDQHCHRLPELLQAPPSIAPRPAPTPARSCESFSAAVNRWPSAWRERAMSDEPRLSVVLARGLHKRCPRCGEGPLFRRFNIMHDRCSVCGLKYLENQGDLLGYLFVLDRALFVLPLIVMVYLRLYLPGAWWFYAAWGAAMAGLVLTLPQRTGFCVAADYYLRRRREADHDA